MTKVATTVFAILAFAIPAFAQDKAKFNVGEARKSVVLVKRITPGLGPAIGSGFIVSDDGLVYTNRHVVQPNDDTIKGTILYVGVPTAADAEVLEYFKAVPVVVPERKDNLDFAVLKIARKGDAKFRPLPLSYDKAGLGDDVAVLGFPYVFENQPTLSFTKGSVSAGKVNIDQRSYYQTDAVINGGNSGGPLLNAKGEAVGIVTMKKANVNNIGFALHLAETKNLLETIKTKSAAAKPEVGPVDVLKQPVNAAVLPKKEHWIQGEGAINEKYGKLVLDNNGGQYWMISKEPLPQNFQLVMQCRIEFLKGGQFLQPSQESILRTLCVRFDSPDVKSEILERKGSLIQFSHQLLLLYREGAGDAVAVGRRGNSERPFVFVVTRKGSDYTIAVDDEVVLRYSAPKVPQGRHPVCIGGYLSRLHVGEVSIIDLDENNKTGDEMPWWRRKKSP